MREMEVLQAAIANTRAMLSAAQQAEWSKIAQLDAERASLLEQAFPLPHDVDPAEARPLMNELIELNQQVEKYCAEARQELQIEMSRFTQKKHAAAAYRSV